MNPVLSENRTSAGAVRPATRRLLVAFAVLTFLAVTQLLLLADVADRFWAWAIPTEMTAAFLGAAYAAGFVLAVASLREHDWSRIRVALLTVTAVTWLTAIATVVHLHKLLLLTGGPFARAVAWVWLAVYLVIPLACVAVVAGQELRRVGADVVVRPMPAWLTVLLGAQGLVLFTVGVLLFGSGMTVHHGEPRAAAAFWPWALMPLGAQVIGAWLMALGVAAALAIRQRDLSRLLVSAMTYTTFGVCQFVAVFWHWSQFSRRDHWLWAYLMVLVVIVLTGAYGWWPRGGRPAIRSWPRRAGSPPRRPPAGARTAQAEAARGRSGPLRCAAAVLLADELDEGIQVPRRTVHPPGEPHRRGVPDAPVDDARAGMLGSGGLGGDADGLTGRDDGAPVLDPARGPRGGRRHGRRPQLLGRRPAEGVDGDGPAGEVVEAHAATTGPWSWPRWSGRFCWTSSCSCTSRSASLSSS